MYFVSGMPTKIDSWGRYGSPYSPHHIWSEEPEGGRARDGFDDSNIIYIRDPNSTFDNIFSNQCHIINMFNLWNTFFSIRKIHFIWTNFILLIICIPDYNGNSLDISNKRMTIMPSLILFLFYIYTILSCFVPF